MGRKKEKIERNDTGKHPVNKEEITNPSESVTQANSIRKYWDNTFRMGSRELLTEIMGPKPTEEEVRNLARVSYLFDDLVTCKRKKHRLF